VPAENPPQGDSARSSVQNTNGESSAARREYEAHRQPQGEQQQDAGSGEPDVLLDVPVLKVEEINLTVEGLRAHVAVLAELADLVKLSVGADVSLDKVELEIKGVEAQALLKVRLEQVRAILDKALSTIGENPEILQSLVRTVNRTLGQVGQTANEAVGQVADQVGSLLEESVNEAGQTVQRVVDESGSVVERTLNESGEVLDEAVVGDASNADSEG
jgi:ElaB/YqjD/DUF883 family membrane-anchored ribosome-binding protein